MRTGTVLTIGSLPEVDIGMSERLMFSPIPAEFDRFNWTCREELLKEVRLGHIGVKIPNIQSRHGKSSSRFHVDRGVTKHDEKNLI